MAIGPVQLLVLARMPDDSAAALILPEHHREVPLRAVARAGGFRIDGGFISRPGPVAVGLVTAADAERMHALDRAAGVDASVAGGTGPGAGPTAGAGIPAERR
jgi:hypothetical protein